MDTNNSSYTAVQHAAQEGFAASPVNGIDCVIVLQPRVYDACHNNNNIALTYCVRACKLNILLYTCPTGFRRDFEKEIRSERARRDGAVARAFSAPAARRGDLSEDEHRVRSVRERQSCVKNTYFYFVSRLRYIRIHSEKSYSEDVSECFRKMLFNIRIRNIKSIRIA